jgi:hypothetical protein
MIRPTNFFDRNPMTTEDAAHDAAQAAVAEFALAADEAGHDLAALGEAMVHAGMIALRRAVGAEEAAFTALVITRAALTEPAHVD